MKTRSKQTKYKTKKTDLGRLGRKGNALKREMKRNNPPTRSNIQRLASLEADFLAAGGDDDMSDTSTSSSTRTLPSPMVQVANNRVQTRRQVQECPINCLIYGDDRELTYPDYFFCSNCKKYDDRKRFTAAPFVKNKETSPKYRCTAGHTDPTHPTVRKEDKSYCQIKNYLKKHVLDRGEVTDHISVTEIVNDPTTLTPGTSTVCTSYHDEVNDSDSHVSRSTVTGNSITALKKRIRELEYSNTSLKHELYSWKAKYRLCDSLKKDSDASHHEIITKLEDEIVSIKKQIELFNRMRSDYKELKKMNRDEQKTNQKLNSRVAALNHQIKNIKLESLIPVDIKLDDFFSLLIPCFVKVSSQKNRSHNNMSDSFVDFIWNATFLSGCIRSSIIEFTKKYFRETIYSPSRILELLDMNGGQLSYQGIDLLRELETNGEKYVQNTIIPHSSSIKRVCAVVDKYASIVVPFKMDKLEDGSEYAEFQPEDVISLMYKGYQLENIAKERSICIDQAIDAAMITKRQHVTVFGVKMVDAAARDPKTGKLLYACNDASIVQSRNNCFPIKIAAARETNSVFGQFRKNMEAVKRLTEQPLHDYQPIKCAMDCDLSATWKLLLMGGAMRNKTFGCHLCAEKKDFPGQHYGVRCNKWCKKLHPNNDNIKCRHSPIFSPENVKKMIEKKAILKEVLGELENNMKFLIKNSSIKCKEDPRGLTDIQSKYDIESIHYDLTLDSNDNKEKDLYLINITNDLMLRNLDTTGSALVRQQRLKESLINEWTYCKLTESTEYFYANHHQRLLSIIECVPCILHMENRCGIKILFMLLTEGIKNATNNNTFKSFSTVKQRATAFIKAVEDIANKEILGNKDYPACWHLPVNGKNEIENITLDNNRTRALMYNLESLIDLCLADDDKKIKFKECISHYRSLFTLLRKKDDFSDDDINKFQTIADYFYSDWIDLYGADGITNYIHMIGSGHVADFLSYYRNLYIHSQQGWEHFNSFLKVYFFRRTMRGGGNSGGSKIKPLARWLGRRMVWMAGNKYKYMDDIVKNKTVNNAIPIDDESTNNENDVTNIHEDNGIEVENYDSFI